MPIRINVLVATVLTGLAAATSAWTQTGSADRVIPAETQATPTDNFMVKLLRPLGPYQNLPISSKLRWQEFKDDTIGFFPLFRTAADAALSQGIDNPGEWHQGMEGYAKRFASDLAVNGVHESIAFGAAALFHEDNRYIASGKDTAKGRVIHALLSPFETHKADGSVALSYSNILGATGAGFISRLWLPGSQQGGDNIARCIGFSFLSEAGFNTFREFVPDLIRKLQHREPRQ